MIIALTGKAGAGKSTAAEALVALGFVRVRFAAGLKAMLRALLAARGVPADRIERMIEGDLKEVPARELGGRSPRYAMQRLGNEWGRDLMAPGLWVEAWRDAAFAALAAGAPGVVVEDCRYPNEAAALRAAGGIVARVERPGHALAVEAHVSEAHELPADFILVNDRRPEDLRVQLLALWSDRARPAA